MTFGKRRRVDRSEPADDSNPLDDRRTYSHLASRFLDVEVQDGSNDEGDWSEYDSESHHDSGDHREPLDVDECPFSFQLDRLTWSDLTGNNARDSDLLREIASDIRLRYLSRRPVSNIPCLGTSLLPLPAMPEDPALWRVRVKKGCEKDVVLMIFRRAASVAVAGSSIISAFTRSGIPGCVYVEATLVKDVRDILTGIFGVLRSRNSSCSPSLTCVPIDDRDSLLTVREACVTPGSWVRIMAHSHFKNDLALVCEIDRSSCDATIIVLPRIHLCKKHARTRPPRSLFDEEKVRKIYGNEAVRKRGEFWTFRSKRYKDGLEHLSIHLQNLSSNSVNPTQEELTLYRSCQNQRVIQAVIAYQTTVDLTIDDKVTIIAGQHQKLFGSVAGIQADGTVTVALDDSTLPLLVVGRWELRRSFKNGDFVQVIAGVDECKEGFIIDLDPEAKTATLYCPGSQLPWPTPADEVVVLLEHLQAKCSDAKLRGVMSVVGPISTCFEGFNRRFMFTGDPYEGLEVSIHTGELKNHFAVVKGTREVGGSILATLLTENRSINHIVELDIDNLRERHTRLPLHKAIWVPRSQPSEIPGYLPTQDRPPTPQPNSNVEASTEDSSIQHPAWDPSSRTPPSLGYDHDDPLSRTPLLSSPRELQPGMVTCVIPHSVLLQHSPGEWLLDRRLRHKLLDVRIKGTDRTLWHNGRYEGKIGCLELTKNVSSVQDSVIVKVGYEQSKIPFQLRYLEPERTTERERFIEWEDAQPIILVIGERVVIIGADLDGNTDLIGSYAIVVHCPWPLARYHVCLQVLVPGISAPVFRYFEDSSLCRSPVEAL